MKKLSVEIWSDIACPWCYIGKRRFEEALAGFAHKDDVEVSWRSFELDPDAPSERGVSHAQLLSGKYGMSVKDAEGKLAEMTRTAAAAGLEFRFDRSRSGNTFDGHRLIHLAAEHGLGDKMKERLLRAYFTDGELIASTDTLVTCAVEVGLDEAEVRGALATDAYADEVRKDEAEARQMGIRGVPCFVIDRKYGVSGAQPAGELRAMLDKAYGELAVTMSDGEVCGPDGCA
jgi:predicted DsbA family dithiol-disulfide isomerase